MFLYIKREISLLVVVVVVDPSFTPSISSIELDVSKHPSSNMPCEVELSIAMCANQIASKTPFSIL